MLQGVCIWCRCACTCPCICVRVHLIRPLTNDKWEGDIDCVWWPLISSRFSLTEILFSAFLNIIKILILSLSRSISKYTGKRFQLAMYTHREVSSSLTATWYSLQNESGLKDGWSLFWSVGGQWFPFPCQRRNKQQDTGGYFCSATQRRVWTHEICCELKIPAFKKTNPPLSPLSPLSPYLHYAFFCLCFGATVAAPDSLRSGVTGCGLL